MNADICNSKTHRDFYIYRSALHFHLLVGAPCWQATTNHKNLLNSDVLSGVSCLVSSCRACVNCLLEVAVSDTVGSYFQTYACHICLSLAHFSASLQQACTKTIWYLTEEVYKITYERPA